MTKNSLGINANRLRLGEFDTDRPLLTVVVDTEEEFDWSAPFSRDSRDVTNAVQQSAAHEIFDTLNLVPTYVMDQAIVDDDRASDFFRTLLSGGKCDIGVHLHPWLTPPYDEALTDRNSFHGNLPRGLEQAKIETLTQCVAERFGRRPTVFKAGRYGVGPNTYSLLRDAGFRVDCSIVPYTSFTAKGGPDFSDLPETPFWADDGNQVLCVPLTRGFCGYGQRFAHHISGIFDASFWQRSYVPSIMSRSGFLNRVTLTPEGVSAEEQVRLLETLYNSGTRFFSLAYHSSSLGVGNTSYVKTEQELQAFLENLKYVLTFFSQELGGRFVTLDELRNLMAEDS